MDIPTHADLVRQIDQFLLRHDMKPSRLAREATGEPALIDAIRDGKRSPTLNTVQKLAEYMKRKDAELALNPPPLELTPPPQDEEEIALPFGMAPGSGASLPTSSTTRARPRSSGANASCSADDAK